MNELTLPTFILAGAMRCGTTSLSAFLGGRHDIHMAGQKEIHFFDRHFDKGLDWYSSQFHLSPGQLIVGESTPNYIYDDVARERMAKSLPEAQIILVLRNPVERAYSHYWMARQHGSEVLEFEAAVEAEPRRLTQMGRIERSMVSYLDRGRYIDQIEDLAAVTGSSRVGVWIFEELRQNAETLLPEVLQFLHAAPELSEKDGIPRVNAHRRIVSPVVYRRTKRMPGPLRDAVARVNSTRRPYPPMPKHVRVQLEALFAPYNRRLEDFLGRPVTAWHAGTGNA